MGMHLPLPSLHQANAAWAEWGCRVQHLEVLRLGPGLCLSQLSVSPGRIRGAGATVAPSKQAPAQGCCLHLDS